MILCLYNHCVIFCQSFLKIWKHLQQLWSWWVAGSFFPGKVELLPCPQRDGERRPFFYMVWHSVQRAGTNFFLNLCERGCQRLQTSMPFLCVIWSYHRFASIRKLTHKHSRNWPLEQTWSRGLRGHVVLTST